MSEDMASTVIYENRHNPNRPKEIVMFLDNKKGIYRKPEPKVESEVITPVVVKPKEIVMYLDLQNGIHRKSFQNDDDVDDDDGEPVLTNSSSFECEICMMEIGVRKGIKIRACRHEFCRECLSDHIQNNESSEVECPGSSGCIKTLSHREVRALVTVEQFEQFLKRNLTEGRSELKNYFECRKTDCKGSWVYDDDATIVRCPMCHGYNCMPCKALHTGKTCREYQDKLLESDATVKLFEQLIIDGEAIKCPGCNIFILKNEGCAWIMCAMCKLEICWPTKGPRWGPLGKGDTSGGCKCNFAGGNKCHPDCNYCH